MPQRRVLAALVVAGCVLTGCAGNGGSTDSESSRSPADGPAAPPTASTTGSTTGSTTATTTGAPVSPVTERCQSAAPDRDDVELLTLTAPGLNLPAAVVPPAGGAKPRLGVVMLPQTDTGLCGGLLFADHLSGDGVATVSIDVCGYGAAACEDDETAPSAQVALAVEEVRRRGAKRVVLIGASMGAALTVRSVAEGADVAAWVDLSGPPQWQGYDTSAGAEAIDRPGLVAYARTDGTPGDFAAARKLAAAADAVFLPAAAGHGWELLHNVARTRVSRLGERVSGFVVGQAPAGG